MYTHTNDDPILSRIVPWLFYVLLSLSHHQIMYNVNPGLINPKQLFNWGVQYQIMTILGVAL
jgi:hypothetical protein